MIGGRWLTNTVPPAAGRPSKIGRYVPERVGEALTVWTRVRINHRSR